MPELEDRLARSLGPWADRAGAIARALEGHGHGVGSLEGSIRVDRVGVRGARMMIEHLDVAAARDVLEALPIAIDVSRGWLDDDGHPRIVGWDAAEGIAKLYVNVSDASQSRREAIARALGVEGGAPHVIGLNASGAERELKVYEQSDALGEDAPEALRAIARAIPIAGVVRSFDVRGGARTARAVFVAPRSLSWDGLDALPGVSREGAERALPFAPGLVRSVGMSVAGDAWTIYVKPRGAESALWRLEPQVCVARGDVEIGVFVAPSSETARAYRRARDLAISYRVRSGSPSPEEIDVVMRWAEERVASSAPLDSPPGGWRVVAA